MTDILDSVIEDLKQEKIHTAMRRYGKFLILLIVLLLICGLLFNWWKAHKENLLHAEAAEYIKAHHFLNKVTSQQMLQEGVGRLEKLLEGNTVYATVAALNLANIHDAMGNFNKAAHIYGTIEGNKHVDQSLRAFSGLMRIASYLRAEKITNEEGLKMLQERHRVPTFSYSRQLLEASLLIQDNKKDKARALLDNTRVTAFKDQQNSIPALLSTLVID
ncbi:MAG: tetratricopeptide repeat protein [Candidatus Midichloria sp.]|uniref:Tetratricopeptide repeat protein n=1 Tax=Hyalomma marginatum TaxID=34627 RepID=A0A8S4C3S8_9ACAR|nr:tetratricopeptide repeat protein [Hyalomma marginatum]CAG7592709.1 tetratricopeptide repeat protein [Hyalomma marginatum]